MPWITLTLPPLAGARPVPADDSHRTSDEELCRAVGAAAADALALTPADVVVLLTRAVAGGGGAVVTVTGSPRADGAEQRLRTLVAATVADALGLPVDLVAVVRQTT
ncbi:hypothetical protein GCM10009867_36380 [Pedococcus aerophilus]|uniref:Uncharacterized protein n=1 Tax=Pedococcus aerophilus TaxID=436356 RepID=A0ABN3UW69_9MICO